MQKAAYFTEKITENGTALCHIVIAAGADEQLAYAAEELAYHIKKVSGADIPVVNEAMEGSLPIMIATPDTLPELETLFPEDLAWLRRLSDEDGRNWAPDGFSIQLREGKLYIFGAVAKGALNGTYDFIEKNMDIIWARAFEDIGLIYTEMPTILLKKTDYHEKSPFAVRGWHPCSAVEINSILYSRNKLNAVSGGPFNRQGLDVLGVAHNVKNLVKCSPIYDHEVQEYWNTTEDGSYCTFENSVQINYYSDKAADAVAASIIERLKAGEVYPFIGIEDKENFGANAGYDGKPFEYAPGRFVEPTAREFHSTIYFTFINKVVRRVKEVFPDGKIATFAYLFTEPTPLCEVESNVLIVMAPINEELSYAYDDPRSEENSKIYASMEAWRKKGVKMVFYNYYGCFKSGDRYTRPIWDRIKEHLCYYRDCGFYGLIPEGQGDDGSSYCWYLDHTDNMWWNYPYEPAKADPNHYLWAMNGMTFWIYHKLSWNPDLDVDALLAEYCDKVYGKASAAMQEYCRLMKLGWEAGRDDMPYPYNWWTPWELHEDAYLFNPKFEENPETANLMGRILDTLNAAWDVADDRAKENIRMVKERMETARKDYTYAPRTPYGQW